MNRQQKRHAEKRMAKGYFPFPELQDWLRDWLSDHPETFAQVREDKIVTNLSGETQEYDIAGFRELLERLKTEDETTTERS